MHAAARASLLLFAAACSRTPTGTVPRTDDDASVVAVVRAEAGAITAAAEPLGDPRTRALGAMLGGGPPAELANIRAALAAERADGGSPAELAFVDKLLALLDRADAATKLADFGARSSAMRAVMVDSVPLLRELADAMPSDAAIQMQAIGALYGAAYALRGPDEAAIRRDAIERIARLAAAFPTNAKVHALRSAMCGENGEDPAVCLRLDARCFELDPKGECVERYARRAKAFVAPRCAKGFIKPTLAVHAGSWVAAPGLRPANGPDGRALFVDPKPLARSTDLAGLRAFESHTVEYEPVTVGDTSPAAMASAMANQTGLDGGTVRIQHGASILLGAAGKKAFEDWASKSKRDREMDAAVVIMDGTTVLVALRLPYDPTRLEGRLAVVDLSVDALCTKVEHPPLPAGLPAPPPAP